MPDPKKNPFDESKRQKYTRLLGQLDQERQQIFNDWRDLCDFIRPTRGRFFLGNTERNRARTRRSKQIIDSSGSFAAGTLASGMMSGVTSPARPWFRLTVPDPDLAEYASVKNWLHDVTVRMQMRYVRSNFYNKLPLVYNDLGVFGTSAVLLEEDDLSGLRYYDLPIGSYYLALDERQKVGVFAREFQMTVRQIVKKFGVIKGTRDIDWSRISTAVKNQWDLGNYDTYLEVGHVIEPNEGYDREKFGSAYLPYSSCYYEKGNQNSDILLEEKGYHEFPVFAPRWEVTGEDAYGTSCPGMVALGDIKALQVMKKRGLQAIEKGVNPPMVASTSMRSSKLSQLPGDVSYVDETQTQKFRPAHEVSVNLNDLRQETAEVRALIRRAFYEDLFLMLTYGDQQQGAQPVTAREIEERHEEKLLVLGPTLEQINQDLLDPNTERSFNIMNRRGEIPPPPRELEGIELRVEYISIMAQAQKAVGRAGMQDFIGFVNGLAGEDPSSPVWDKVDRDQAIDEYSEMSGVPPRVVVSEEQVQATRTARAQQNEANQRAALIQSQARSAKDLAAADTGGKNALTDILGNLGGASGVAAA
jgi:hypothetical protein